MQFYGVLKGMGTIEVKRPEFKPLVSLHTCVDMYMRIYTWILYSVEKVPTPVLSSANNSHCRWYSLVMQIVNFKRSKKGRLFPYVPQAQPFPWNSQNSFQLAGIWNLLEMIINIGN